MDDHSGALNANQNANMGALMQMFLMNQMMRNQTPLTSPSEMAGPSAKVEKMDDTIPSPTVAPENGNVTPRKNTSITETKKKTSIQTRQQQHRLYVEALKDFYTYHHSSEPDNVFWNNLTKKLNAVLGASQKSPEQWKQVFARWRCDVNKKSRMLRQKPTEDQLPPIPLSDLEKKLLRILAQGKKKSASKDSALADPGLRGVLSQISDSLKQLVELKNREVVVNEQKLRLKYNLFDSPTGGLEDDDDAEES